MAITFKTTIEKNPDQDAGWVVFPYDLRTLTGKGRAKVHATFDGVPYDGSIVNMGLKNNDGSICYILGMPRAIRKDVGKSYGDEVTVSIEWAE
ncbi:MAG: DUF1905 domain-containing protein [Bacteroidales bacterium]|nr:DUF1905 domain-containing protein [Bacteroidales bacterium]